MKPDHLADDGYFISYCILVPVRGRPTSDGKPLVSWTSESGTLFLEDEGLNVSRGFLSRTLWRPTAMKPGNVVFWVRGRGSSLKNTRTVISSYPPSTSRSKKR